MKYDRNFTPLFGPSGHSEKFLQEHSATIDMPKWVSNLGLELFEYSFGKGVRLSESTAIKIGEEAEKYGIEISVHAPYFISLASVEPEKVDNSIGYLIASLKALRCLKGNRCVFNVVNDRHYLPIAYILYDNLDNGNSQCHKSAFATRQRTDTGKAYGTHHH